MSLLLGSRDLPEPYDEVTALLSGVERVSFKANAFERMFEQYVADSSFSPVYIYLRKPNDRYHALLVVARTAEGRYWSSTLPFTWWTASRCMCTSFALTKRIEPLPTPPLRGNTKAACCLSCHQWRLTGGQNAP